MIFCWLLIIRNTRHIVAYSFVARRHCKNGFSAQFNSTNLLVCPLMTSQCTYVQLSFITSPNSLSLRIHFILVVDFLCIQEGGLIKLSKLPLTASLERTAEYLHNYNHTSETDLQPEVEQLSDLYVHPGSTEILNHRDIKTNGSTLLSTLPQCQRYLLKRKQWGTISSMNTHSITPPYSSTQYHGLNIYTVAMVPAMEQFFWKTFFYVNARDMDRYKTEKLKAAVCIFDWLNLILEGKKSCHKWQHDITKIILFTWTVEYWWL